MPSPPPPLITSSSTASSRGGPGRSTGSYCLPPACYHRTSHMCRHRTPTTRGGPRAVEDRCRSRVEAARGGLHFVTLGDKERDTRRQTSPSWRHLATNSPPPPQQLFTRGDTFLNLAKLVYIIAQSQYSNFIKRQKSMVYDWSK